MDRRTFFLRLDRVGVLDELVGGERILRAGTAEGDWLVAQETVLDKGLRDDLILLGGNRTEHWQGQLFFDFWIPEEGAAQSFGAG